MTIKKRLLLLAVGIIIFLILAPLAIFFARGFRFDFSEGEITKTGALIVETDPRGATVHLNDKILKKTPLTKRFLIPGEYQVIIEKDNFKSWSKTITIHSQIVTNPALRGKEKVVLIFETPEIKTIATSTAGALLLGDHVLFLGPGSELFFADKKGRSKNLITTIQSKLQSPKILDLNEEKETLVMDGDGTWYISETREILLPRSLSQINLSTKPETVLGLDPERNLVEYNVALKEQKILQIDVDSYTLVGADIYILQNSELVELDSSGTRLTIINNLPDYERSDIIVSSDRQIFLLLDTTLYQVKEELVKLNENVKYAKSQNGSATLVYGNKNEAWLYRPLYTKSNELLIRSSSEINQPIFNQATGYFFYSSESEIKAVETSFDGQANSYAVYKSKSKNVNFSVDGNGEYIIVQDGDDLFSLKIR